MVFTCQGRQCGAVRLTQFQRLSDWLDGRGRAQIALYLLDVTVPVEDPDHPEAGLGNIGQQGVCRGRAQRGRLLIIVKDRINKSACTRRWIGDDVLHTAGAMLEKGFDLKQRADLTRSQAGQSRCAHVFSFGPKTLPAAPRRQGCPTVRLRKRSATIIALTDALCPWLRHNPDIRSGSLPSFRIEPPGLFV